MCKLAVTFQSFYAGSPFVQQPARWVVRGAAYVCGQLGVDKLQGPSRVARHLNRPPKWLVFSHFLEHLHVHASLLAANSRA
eukprot:scaffold1938_cov399-Prasinococcus_capsulatus_cf.AAC.20